MSFARKFKRSHGIATSKTNRLHCCGQKMQRKEGYDTEEEIFLFCEVCGKERYVKKEVIQNDRCS